MVTRVNRGKRTVGGRFAAGIALAFAILLAAQGCSYLARGPMDVLWYKAGPPQGNRCLIVFLMGMGSGPGSFERLGFVDAVREAGLCCDMVAPNAHLAYYLEENLAGRLMVDVIEPALKEGYRRIWLVGISMGGLGSIFSLKGHPGEFDGILLIAPFLGYYRIFGEIEKAGGLSSWNPGHVDEGDWQRSLWCWLKSYDHRGPGRPPIYLSFGDRDPYGKGHRLLASALPPERVIIVDGAHDGKTFVRLWRLFLSTGAIPPACE